MTKKELIERLHEVHTDQELEILIDEYADEQSREAFDQGYDHALNPNKYYGYDEWKSNQKGE